MRTTAYLDELTGMTRQQRAEKVHEEAKHLADLLNRAVLVRTGTVAEEKAVRGFRAAWNRYCRARRGSRREWVAYCEALDHAVVLWESPTAEIETRETKTPGVTPKG